MGKKVSLLKQLLRTCWFAVPLVGLISSAILYIFRQTSIPSFYIVTLIAWLASDGLITLFVRGGNGILQIRLFRTTKSQFKGYGFLVFFGAIFAIAIGVNISTDYLTKYLSSYLSNGLICLGLGLVLALLVFLDLNAKFYNRDQKA